MSLVTPQRRALSLVTATLYTGGMRSLLVLMITLTSTATLARDVAVLDRGGGPARVALVTAAFQHAGDVVLAPEEVREIDVAYAADCTDAACYARAGVAGGVAVVVVVEAEDIVFVEVEGVSQRRRRAPTEQIAEVVARALDTAHFGTLGTVGLPSGTSLMIAGVPYDGRELPLGAVSVLVQRPGVDPLLLTHDVVAGENTIALPPATAADAELDVGLHPGMIVAGVGVGVGVVGAVVFTIGELQFLDAYNRGDVRGLAAPELLANAGLAVVAVGVVTAGAGVLAMLLSAE